MVFSSFECSQHSKINTNPFSATLLFLLHSLTHALKSCNQTTNQIIKSLDTEPINKQNHTESVRVSDKKKVDKVSKVV